MKTADQGCARFAMSEFAKAYREYAAEDAYATYRQSMMGSIAAPAVALPEWPSLSTAHREVWVTVIERLEQLERPVTDPTSNLLALYAAAPEPLQRYITDLEQEAHDWKRELDNESITHEATGKLVVDCQRRITELERELQIARAHVAAMPALSEFERKDLETTIQNEHVLYADAWAKYEAAQSALATARELLFALWKGSSSYEFWAGEDRDACVLCHAQSYEPHEPGCPTPETIRRVMDFLGIK